MSVKVYKFWCEPSSKEDSDLLFEQCRLYREYRRRLADAENEYRAENQRIHLLGADYGAARARVDALLAIAKDQRSPSWKDDLRQASVNLSKAGKARRTEADYVTLLESAQARCKVVKKSVRGTLGPKGAGLGWGSYLQAEESHDAASKATKIYDRVRVKLERGEGVAVASYNSPDAPTYADVVAGECSYVRIGPLTSKPSARRDGRARAKRLRVVQIRLLGGKSPKWLSVYGLLHREPPPDAIIAAVRVHQFRVGPRFRWSLQMVVKTADALSIRTCGNGAVGVDLGWRANADGSIQVAVAVDQHGVEQRLVIPYEVARRALEDRSQADGKHRCATLRSTRDQHFDRIREALKALRETAPDWFRQETVALHAWRSPGRLVRLLGMWRKQRWAGDEAAFLAVEMWKKQDDHLWAWEANNRAKMTRQIDGLYHAFAASLVNAYETIKIENLKVGEAKENWRKQAEAEFDAGTRPKKGTTADERSGLAVARFQKILERHAARTGASLGEVEKAYTSRRCACGHVNDASAERVLTCGACGKSEDRDVRAARNIASGEVLTWLTGPLAAPKSPKNRRKRSNRRAPRADVVQLAA